MFSEGEGCVSKCLERFDFLFLLKALNNFFTNIGLMVEIKKNVFVKLVKTY